MIELTSHLFCICWWLFTTLCSPQRRPWYLGVNPRDRFLRFNDFVKIRNVWYGLLILRNYIVPKRWIQILLVRINHFLHLWVQPQSWWCQFFRRFLRCRFQLVYLHSFSILAIVWLPWFQGSIAFSVASLIILVRRIRELSWGLSG